MLFIKNTKTQRRFLKFQQNGYQFFFFLDRKELSLVRFQDGFLTLLAYKSTILCNKRCSK